MLNAFAGMTINIAENGSVAALASSRTNLFVLTFYIPVYECWVIEIVYSDITDNGSHL